MTKALPFVFLPFFAFAQIPAGYYSGTENLSGYPLKTKLHEIISKKTYSYHYSDVIGLYANTDLDHYYENDGSILDIYSEKPNGPDAYNYNLTQNISGASAEGQGWNREHGTPNSNFYSIYPMYSDLHYLIPTDAYVNQRRSNYPYGWNNGSLNVFTNGSKLGKSTTPGYSNSNTVYEPIDEFKGDVARYLLYFVVRYEGSLRNFNYLIAASPLDGTEEKGFEDWYINMLKEWNALDPVSQKEIDRNNAVYDLENVRNPFIDHPEFVNLIWTQTPATTPPESPSGLLATDRGESFIKLQWQPSASADVLGYQIFQNGMYIGYTRDPYFYADRLLPDTSYTYTVKAYNTGFLFSADTTELTTATTGADGWAKDLMITKYIEGSDSNTALEITNLTGHEVNLNNYYLSAQYYATTTGNFYFGESYQLQGTIQHGESKVIINPYAQFSAFSPSDGDFITNAPPLKFWGSQYVELSYGKKTLKTASTNNYEMRYYTVDAVGSKGIANTNFDKSLYRNAEVTDPTSIFKIEEWTEYPMDYTTGLGQFVLGTHETVKNEQIIYPNPVSGDYLYIKAAHPEQIATVAVYDMSGKLVIEAVYPFKKQNYLDISKLPAGMYLLKTDTTTVRFIRQ